MHNWTGNYETTEEGVGHLSSVGYNKVDQTRQRMSAMRDEIDQEYDVWYEDVSRLATIIGSPTSISIQGSLLSALLSGRILLAQPAIPLCDHLSADFHSRFSLGKSKGRWNYCIVAHSHYGNNTCT